MALAILHNVIIGQPVRLDACISKGEGCAKRTYNATLCNLASDDLHTGINGTVVVGVQCLFALFFSFGIALCHRRNEDGNVLWSVGKNNAKSMTVANGGNAIEDRRSDVFVRLGLAKAVFFLCVGRVGNLFLSPIL